MTRVPIIHFDNPEELMPHFDGAFNASEDSEGDSFQNEYAGIHALFKQAASKFFPGVSFDDFHSGVSLVPLHFAASRKLGMVLDFEGLRAADFTRWVWCFLSSIPTDYMVTVDTYGKRGQMFLCFTRSTIYVAGSIADLALFGLADKFVSIDCDKNQSEPQRGANPPAHAALEGGSH